MPIRLRQLLLFGPPALVAVVNLEHPILPPAVYSGVLHHLRWWLTLHIVNLVLFPLLGFSAYLLIRDVGNVAATLSKVAIAVFVPLYAAFDALKGVGTGTLVQISLSLTGEQRATVTSVVDNFFGSATLYATAAAGSIAWVIAMLAMVVAFTPERRSRIVLIALIVFIAGGWARTNLFLAADGMTIRSAWWLVTAAMALLIFAVAEARMTGALLVLAGALFGASQVPPTGPLGAACFLAAALYVEFVVRKQSLGMPRAG
jgi:hypothetical protein